MKRWTLPATALLAIIAHQLTSAQTQPAATKAPEPPAGPKTPTANLAISPHAIERPVLEYALMFKADEIKKGNAALKYAAATDEMPNTINGRSFESQDYDAIDNLRKEPLATLDDKKAQSYILPYGPAIERAQSGAQLDSYDTQSEIREKGFRAPFVMFGKHRQICNILAVAIRVDIKHHRWGQARQKLATGFGIASHLAQSDTVIEGLVGTAIASVMAKCLEDWITEGGPNLYWNLVNMPRPFINLRRAWGVERATAVFSFPELKEMRAGKFSVESWMTLTRHQFQLIDDNQGLSKEPVQISASLHQLSAAAYGAMCYPTAKEFLIARGMKREDVEKMPVAEALERHFVRSYDELADEVFKGLSLPVPEAMKVSDAAEKEIAETPVSLANPFVRALITPFGRTQMLTARVDRQLDMLRIVEAIRAYAAEKKQLPEKLADLALPIPEDVITGKPFDYARTTPTTATLRSINGSQLREGAAITIQLKP